MKKANSTPQKTRNVNISTTSSKEKIDGHSEDLPFFGVPNSHVISPRGTKERWYNDVGEPIKDRHNKTNGNLKRHPIVPHDHDWNKNLDGSLSMGKGHEIVDIAVSVGVVYGGYLCIKWAIAIIGTPITGGGSLVIAGVTP